MSKPPSAETQLRHLRREFKELAEEMKQVKIEVTQYRGRSQRAENEAAEWKRRFDTLLAKGFGPSDSDEQA